MAKLFFLGLKPGSRVPQLCGCATKNWGRLESIMARLSKASLAHSAILGGLIFLPFFQGSG